MAVCGMSAWAVQSFNALREAARLAAIMRAMPTMQATCADAIAMPTEAGGEVRNEEASRLKVDGGRRCVRGRKVIAPNARNDGSSEMRCSFRLALAALGLYFAPLPLRYPENWARTK